MIYFYGGAFDPITLAHEEIIKKLVKRCKNGDSVIVGITNNDEKNYTCDIDNRYKMVTSALHAKLGDNFNKVTVVFQKARTYSFLSNYPGPITIVLGTDEAQALKENKWVNSKKILEKYELLVFSRDNTTDNEQFISLDKKFNTISSSKIREIMYRNPFCSHKDVKDYISHSTYDYIKENHLYYQNGFDYEKKEAEFIAQYQIDKVKNGWTEPSVTADILAHNGNKVLLIRRGNYPYKNCWCLPGGFFDKTDSCIEATGARELMEETCIETDYKKFKQIKTYSHIFDPRLRIIDVAMSIRVNAKDMKKAIGSDDAAEARWFDIDDLPVMGFHHRDIVTDWLANEGDNG